MSLRERLQLEHPVVGAGLGGGLSRARLTAAIADAGGLGQIGILPPAQLRAELAAHRERSRGPVAVNLLLPFARREHWDVARGADVVVTFWGEPRRMSDGVWVHQCGSVDEARAAAAAGADGVIVQGVEAGGHVRGTTPALELLAQARAALPDVPLWLAGGIAERADVEAALSAGADAVVAGTRFLLSDESDAHPGYQARLLAAHDTVLTELFGAGWPAAPHRVIANAATERWLRGGDRGPRWVRGLQRATAPALARLPIAAMQRVSGSQRPGLPLLGPAAPTARDPDSLLDAGPLYAGETVRRIDAVRPAGELVRALAGVRR